MVSKLENLVHLIVVVVPVLVTIESFFPAPHLREGKQSSVTTDQEKKVAVVVINEVSLFLHIFPFP